MLGRLVEHELLFVHKVDLLLVHEDLPPQVLPHLLAYLLLPIIHLDEDLLLFGVGVEFFLNRHLLLSISGARSLLFVLFRGARLDLVLFSLVVALGGLDPFPPLAGRILACLHLNARLRYILLESPCRVVLLQEEVLGLEGGRLLGCVGGEFVELVAERLLGLRLEAAHPRVDHPLLRFQRHLLLNMVRLSFPPLFNILDPFVLYLELLVGVLMKLLQLLLLAVIYVWSIFSSDPHPISLHPHPIIPHLNCLGRRDCGLALPFTEFEGLL